MFSVQGFSERASPHSSYLFWSQLAYQLNVRKAFQLLLTGKSQSSNIFQFIDIWTRDIKASVHYQECANQGIVQQRITEIKFSPPIPCQIIWRMEYELSLEIKHLCRVDFPLFRILGKNIVDIYYTMKAHAFSQNPDLLYDLEGFCESKMKMTDDCTVKLFI